MWIRKYVRNTEFQLMLSIIWTLILWQLFIRILRSFFSGLVYRFSLSRRQEINDSCQCHTIVWSLLVKTCLRAVFSRDVSEVKVVEIAKKLLERIAGNNPSVTFNTRYYAKYKKTATGSPVLNTPEAFENGVLFLSQVRPFIHAKPSRKLSFWKTSSRRLCVLMWTENILRKTKLFYDNQLYSTAETRISEINSTNGVSFIRLS